MNKDTVSKLLQEATDARGHTNLDLVDPKVITQVANAYVSGASGLLPLYSKAAVAKYYGTTETTVSNCIDRATVYRYLKFNVVRRIAENSGDNERRHAIHRGNTKSEERYARLMEERFEFFQKTFEEEDNRARYDSAYKMYLGQSTLTRVMGSYGLSPEEMLYLLKRKACIDMSPIEYSIFCQKFFHDYLGTPGFYQLMKEIKAFRREMNVQLTALQNLREKNKEETKEFEEIRSMIMEQFEKL